MEKSVKYLTVTSGKSTKRTTKNRWWNCVQTDINIATLQIGKTGQKTELTGRSTLRRQGSALDCSAM